MSSSESAPQAFRPVPRTGVIYVTTEAQKRGFDPASPDWCNLGQGQPETGALPGAPPRIHTVAIDPATIRSTRRSPGSGSCARRSPASTTAPTGAGCPRSTPRRTSASRAAGAPRSRAPRPASGTINLGHFLPDYTAYEELLDIFKAFTADPDPARGRARLRVRTPTRCEEILGRGLSALLLSNPCNPTGKLVQGEELAALGGAGARARLRAAHRRVLLALRLDDGRRRRPRR